MSEIGRVRLFGDCSIQDHEEEKIEEHSKEETNKCGEEAHAEDVLVVRRKRVYDEIKDEDCLEDPKLPLDGEPRREKKCCKESCSEGVDEMIKVSHEIREEFVCESKLATRNKLLLHLIGQRKVGLVSDKFNWKGNFYCVKAFSELSGISIYSIQKVLASHSEGIKLFVHGNSEYCKFSEKTLRFKVWMRSFLERNSQSAPDSQVQVLAHWVTKKALYEMYRRETNEPHLALTTFCAYIKIHFGPNRQDKAEPQLRFSKYSSHSVCDQCCAFNAARSTCKNREDLSRINQLKTMHMNLVGGARQKMEEIKQSAIQFPDDCIVIQIDGMDNSKSYCPRMKEKSKKFAGLLRLPTKIQGCIIYSGHYVDKRKILFYLNHDHFPQSSNMVVSTIQKLLEVVVKDHGSLPRKLHLFADNCYRENKNRYG